MPFAISLVARNPTADPILALWDRFSIHERAPSMRGLGYPAHITLAIYEGDAVDEAEALAALRRAGANATAVRLIFDSIRTFEGDTLVFWASPRPSAALAQLHQAVHAAIHPARCHIHYRPGGWVPHCTLATDIRPDGETAARALAAAFAGVITVDFNAFECVSFRPVRIIETCRLGPSG